MLFNVGFIFWQIFLPFIWLEKKIKIFFNIRNDDFLPHFIHVLWFNRTFTSMMCNNLTCMYISFHRNSQVTTNLPSSPSNSDISETASLPLVIREKDVEYQVIHTLSTCSADKFTLIFFLMIQNVSSMKMFPWIILLLYMIHVNVLYTVKHGYNKGPGTSDFASL